MQLTGQSFGLNMTYHGFQTLRTENGIGQRFSMLYSDFAMTLSNEVNIQLLRLWYEDVVNDYVSRDFTYNTDALIAIEGIVGKLRPHTVGLSYQAGI